jgi:hypothetical protein
MPIRDQPPGRPAEAGLGDREGRAREKEAAEDRSVERQEREDYAAGRVA